MKTNEIVKKTTKGRTRMDDADTKRICDIAMYDYLRKVILRQSW